MSKFVDGLRAFKPHENAPDFVKANLVIKRDDRGRLIEWIAGQPDGDIKLNLKESKGGKFYIAVNTYKKNQSESDEINVEDIPF